MKEDFQHSLEMEAGHIKRGRPNFSMVMTDEELAFVSTMAKRLGGKRVNVVREALRRMMWAEAPDGMREYFNRP